jgi:hypothetical protein
MKKLDNYNISNNVKITIKNEYLLKNYFGCLKTTILETASENI